MGKFNQNKLSNFQMKNQSQPVVFEVPLEKSVSPGKGQVIKRLMKAETASPKTLEQIEQKLNKAKELRELEYTKRIGQISDERLSRARERRSNFVTQKTTKIRTELDVKMEDAIQKRSQLINVIVQKAHKESDKVGKASQCRQERENSMKTKYQVIQEKINQSQANKERLSNDTVLKAKSHTEKVKGVIKSKQEKEA